MASRFFISVGGSGQHVALALTRLVYMGALENDIQLIAIDPDNKEPLSQALQSPAGMTGTHHPLKNGQVFTPFDITKYGEKNFAQMFVDEHNPDERELFEGLFDADMDTIPVHKGMYGTPCVGATVFAEGAQGSSFGNQLAPVQNATEVHVCGSVVGGTGAGITHKLIREIRARIQDTKPMFGIFMLPWFKVQAGGETKGAITQAIIQRNCTHGIKYFYEHTIPALTTSALVGYPENAQSQVLRPLSVGPSSMGHEQPHFLHLVSAFALSGLNKAHTANRDVKAYYLSHDLQKEDWLLTETWEKGKGLLGSGQAHDDQAAAPAVDLRQRIRAHQVVLQLLNFLTAEKAKGEILNYYRAGKVRRAFMSRSAWGDELHASIASAEDNEDLQGAFTDALLAELGQIRQEVKFCVDWANSLFPAGMLRLPQGDPLLAKLTSVPDLWDIVRNAWQGRAIKPLGGRKIAAAAVARSHAKFLLDYAYKA
jgi:hypothetical protein